MTFTAISSLAPGAFQETLHSAPRGVWLSVLRVDLEGPEASWLAAVGVGVGEVLRVLRRAPFGGPFHVASGSGGEFAIGPSLARGIQVERVGASR